MDVVFIDHVILHEVVKFSYQQISWAVPDFENRRSKCTPHYILRHIKSISFCLINDTQNIWVSTLAPYFLLININMNPNKITLFRNKNCISK